MYASPRRRSHNLTRKLRKQAGCWLRELRENRGLSQRELAQKVGAEYYTLISQLEHGYGRIPPSRYLAWANALAVEPHVFVRRLMTYYDSREPDDSCELLRSSTETSSFDPFTEKCRAVSPRDKLLILSDERFDAGHGQDRTSWCAPLRRKCRTKP